MVDFVASFSSIINFFADSLLDKRHDVQNIIDGMNKLGHLSSIPPFPYQSQNTPHPVLNAFVIG